jgi:protein-S-isoprenylcysteine O-methyltransferase Ste14
MKTQITSSEKVKKASSILSFLLLFYVLPLAAKPELILNLQVIFLAVVCSVLFATQPRLSIAESKAKKTTDRNTIWLILLVSCIGQIASLIEWAYFPSAEVANIVWILTGIIFLISGTIFRLYAINVLGKYFSSTVQIKEEHQIITSGPYRFLRHPSYTGAYIAMLGSAIFLHSIIGILVFGIGMLFVYQLRIKTEEQTLTNQFGVAYKLYASRTYKMFPLVW